MHKYIELCTLFEKVESLQSRTEMSLEIANFFKGCTGEEIEIISYMIQGRVAPFFVKSEYNYSEKSLISMLSQYLDTDVQKLRKESGDIGDTVSDIWRKQGFKGKFLTVLDIYEVLWEIVNTIGVGSVSRKNVLVLECLKKLNNTESKYFVRSICGELRLGLSSKTLLEVFSITVKGSKELKEVLEHAYGVSADIGYIGRKVVESKGKGVERVQALPGIPLLPRLVQRVGSFDELSERFENTVYVQPKFDGLRCQIHKWKKGADAEGGNDRVWNKYVNRAKIQNGNLFTNDVVNGYEVRLFTRNLEDVTEMFPEIVDSVRDLDIDSFIMDSEIVGWNYEKDIFLSYQETMQRRRKYSVESKREEIPVRAFVFDLMYINGKSLVNMSSEERFKILREIGVDTPGGIALADSQKVSVGQEIEDYFRKSVELGLEGIIVKDPTGEYKPGLRNYEWVKIKKSIEKDLVDTVDMVIVGFFRGSGRRSNLGVGAILGAIYNEEEETFDAICKIGTGMSDRQLKELFMKLSEISEDRKSKDVRVSDALIPDVWVTPQYVITVDADEITKNISQGQELIGAGLSLRFPRLIEFDREDKGLEDVTTVEELVNMYKMRVGKG